MCILYNNYRCLIIYISSLLSLGQNIREAWAFPGGRRTQSTDAIETPYRPTTSRPFQIILCKKSSQLQHTNIKKELMSTLCNDPVHNDSIPKIWEGMEAQPALNTQQSEPDIGRF